ncbi:MAG TPA: cytidine deaminase [Polyangia bacterium]|jgi:cytidine deaminase|nr:cytidine deaminase [Polyangia bacterium]
MNDLIEAARRVRENAHAPYSRYKVGAAVRTASGKVFVGANVENASYGLALCAERSAIAAAIAAGETRLAAVAVITASSPPAAPCGMCRQVLAEFAADDLPVALVNDAGERSDTTLGALLPHAFRQNDLT